MTTKQAEEILVEQARCMGYVVCAMIDSMHNQHADAALKVHYPRQFLLEELIKYLQARV